MKGKPDNKRERPVRERERECWAKFLTELN